MTRTAALARAGLIVSAAFLLSRLLGYVRGSTMAAVFGLSAELLVLRLQGKELGALPLGDVLNHVDAGRNNQRDGDDGRRDLFLEFLPHGRETGFSGLRAPRN